MPETQKARWLLKASDDPPGGGDSGLIPITEFVAEFPPYEQGDTVLVVGACGGQEAVAVHRLAPQHRVIAIEALSTNVERWLQDLPGIEVVQALIGETEGETRAFYIKMVNGIHSMYDRGAVYGTGVEYLQTVRLDTLCREHNVVRAVAALIDVEGASWDVLAGAGVLLEEQLQVVSVEVEDYPYFLGQQLRPAVDKLLLASGFTCRVSRQCVNIQQSESLWVRAA